MPPLQLSRFSDSVRTMLASDRGEYSLPLVRAGSCPKAQAEKILRASAADLFPAARQPEEARSGLLMRLNCWDESHEVSQNLHTAEGSYWHAIAHRMEPDYQNAGYWFRRVGKHPIFPEILETASSVLTSERVGTWRLKPEWDPFQFIDWCQEAASARGTAKERAALRIQMVEWERLFDWCATPLA